ncbi:MAG: hypothetical protein EP329_05290 [Deltaproteobacteria bacterium]|nr:MAG: hypothetical protein EP329_05290 [Deltaproteobacteria bacterium]
MRRATLLLLLPFAFAACDDGAQSAGFDPETGDLLVDLPVGDVEGLKADGVWGYATTCKPIPNVPPLADPAIVVSLDGLTLHLVDRAGDYDRVFPIGPGSIDDDGLSLTPTSESAPEGVFYTRTDTTAVDDGPTPDQARWAWNYRCRMWWTDTDGTRVPVFAGLPFIRLTGPPTSGYGFHGPVDRYTLESGGKLRRGFVSHGCMRMEPDDIVEVFARIQGHKVPVRIQKAIERLDSGRAVDTGPAWIQTECASDADCSFQGGVCKHNPYSGRGFCTVPCDRYCSDKSGFPTTFCVDDPDDASRGICVNQAMVWTNGCRRYDGFVEKIVGRHGQPGITRSACVPGTEGWIGDRCLAASECETGRCDATSEGEAGLCTQSCTRYCPDKDASYATTFCVDEPEGAGGMCIAQCFSNDDCPVGTTCEDESRHNQSWVVRKVCLPY